MTRTYLYCLVLSCTQLAAENTGVSYSDNATEWQAAVRQSSVFLGVQHAFRVAMEPGTREAMRGPFVPRYAASVGNLGGWDDGDPFLVNYIGHPMEGAVAGYIAIQNNPAYSRLAFNSSPDYWKSRLKAALFAAAYSTQFEIGPISEASIGNIQLQPRARGVVDLVVTPTMGFAWIVAEDALDKFAVMPLERRVDFPLAKMLIRGLLNPTRSFANVFRLKHPWHRDGRAGVLGQP
jgi:hypothetical protein